MHPEYISNYFEITSSEERDEPISDWVIYGTEDMFDKQKCRQMWKLIKFCCIEKRPICLKRKTNNPVLFYEQRWVYIVQSSKLYSIILYGYYLNLDIAQKFYRLRPVF